MELAGKKVLVVGLGRSGIAAAKLLLERGARVIGNDVRAASELPPEARALEALGARLELGAHEAQLFTSVDQIVVSPGVPPLPALAAAEQRGVPIASEIELASWFVKSTIVGITGTNGKSTVTELTGEMCRRSGRPTFVGGNLGEPLVNAVGTPAAEAGGYLVVELSSFQLERVDRLRVHAAALLNVTADHLDRYASMQEYAQAKARIFRNQTPSDAAVVPYGDALCEPLAASGQARVLRFGGEHGDARVEGGMLIDAGSGLRVPLSELGIAGQHNYDNAAAAMLLARSVGVAPAHIEAALRAFKGLPHRMQHVRTLDGIEYFDDSKATNVGATVAALDGLRGRGGRVVLIAGGKDKGGTYDPMVARMRELGRATVLIGEASALIEAALGRAGLASERATDMADAVGRARALAQPGDVVLLAPACASFDMFRSYAHRGDVFQDAVRQLAPAEEAR